jgi:tetratricopeptide (TPR) repeat protein
VAGDLGAYAQAHDLTGVKQAAEAIEVLAARHEGWIPSRELAEGHFQRIRGNLEAALAAYERCLRLCSPDPAEPWRSIRVWPSATAGSILVLVELGRYEQARECGERALELGRARELSVVLHEVSRALALAEARLGDYAGASARLAEVIAAQRALGVSGLHIGSSYEARARIAIWAGDTAAVEEFGRLAAREYRHGRGSPLGALYDRLMDEARRAGVMVLPQLSEFESTMMSATKVALHVPVASTVATILRASDAAERAACALDVICDARGAVSGYLYLLGERGLSLAATDSEDGEPEGLREFITGHLTQELEPEMTTMPDATANSSSRTTFWTDPRGTTYRPFLVTCAIGGRELCAGVGVLLLDGTREPRPGAADIVAAVGAQLIELGDVRGVPLDELTQSLASRASASPR